MSDIILGRIANLLDEVKTSFVEDELITIKKEILNEIDSTSITSIIKNFLMSRIANLFDDDAKKEDIENLKTWMLENIKSSSIDESIQNLEQSNENEKITSNNEIEKQPDVNINKIVDEYDTGILPDFIIKDSATGEFIPAPANLLESENDGNYYYNACRTPWRISMDYLINGNEDALKFANAINNFIISKTGGDPWNIMAGYAPDGTTISDWNDLCFDAPFLVSAACGDNMNWHDSLRDMILNYGEDVYFGDTITMLCLIVDDGCWIVPENVNMSIPGDVNADGTFNISDVVMMQKWLLAVSDIELANWKAADLCEDGKLNVFDLCVMKRMLISQK